MRAASPFLTVDHGRKVVTVTPNLMSGATLSGCYCYASICKILKKDESLKIPFHPPKKEDTASPKSFQRAHFQFCKLPRTKPGFPLAKVNQFFQQFVDEGYRIDVHPRCECKKAFLLTYLFDLGLKDDVENLQDMDEETLQYLLCSALRGEYGGIIFISKFQLEKIKLERSVEDSENQQKELEERLASADAANATLRLENQRLVSQMEELSNQHLIPTEDEGSAGDEARTAELTSLRQERDKLSDRLHESNALIATLQSDIESLARDSTNQKQKLVNNLAKLRSEKKSLEHLMEESTNETHDLENRLARSDVVSTTLQSEKETLLTSIKELTNQRQELEKSLASSNAVVVKIMSVKESIQHRLADSDALVATLQSENKLLVKRTKELKYREEELEDRLVNSDAVVATIKSENKSLVKWTKESKNLQHDLEKRLHNANEFIATLQSDNKSVVKKTKEPKNHQYELEDRLAASGEIVTSLQYENEKLLRSVERSKNQQEELLRRLARSDAVIADLQSEQETFMNSIEESRHQQQFLQNRLNISDTAAAKFQSDKERLQRSVKELKNRQEDLVKRLAGFRSFPVGLQLEKETRLSPKPISEEEDSIRSGMDSRSSASMPNMDIDVFEKEAKDFRGTDQQAKGIVSNLSPHREEEGGESEEPALVNEIATAATSGCRYVVEDLAKSSKSLVMSESKRYNPLTSMRTSRKKRKRLKDAQCQLVLGNLTAPTPPGGLEPTLHAPSLMQPPTTGCCEWSYDEKSRVLHANFRSLTAGKIQITHEDETFLFRMMERDDITVISEGLADEINPALWTREYIEGCIGSEYHHNIRVFETLSDKKSPGTQSIEQQNEKAGWYSMKISDYFQYLEQRRSVKRSNGKVKSNVFCFTDSEGVQKNVNVEKEALYMLDLDLVKLLPQLSQNVLHNFKLPGTLPGGSHCMLNAVNVNGRPFMGPNLYITPPSSFTQFHQDGRGTVDSGHLCLSGYNEVIMLRRLTEKEKHRALRILTGNSDSHGTLYDFPHQDDVETRLTWPSKEAIRRCEELGFCPSVFVLKAGQVLHINKGRLHAFRKLAPSTLCKTDCHFDLRNKILQTKDQLTEENCFSIAWDWMYKGVTCDGINREVSSILECAKLNQKQDLPSLAIPETSLLFLAKQSIAKHQVDMKYSATNSLFDMDIRRQPTEEGRSEPDPVTVLRGILPSLTYVVRSHKSAAKRSDRMRNGKKSSKVSLDSHPNTRENPTISGIDPYGAEDFSCKSCGVELSNVYMHCDGCEKLLNKDYNICCSCHKEGKHRVFHQINPFTQKQESMLNHTGNMEGHQKTKCCGQSCSICSYCTGCSCECHQSFSLHFRFMGLKDEVELLGQAKRIVGSAKKKRCNI